MGLHISPEKQHSCWVRPFSLKYTSLMGLISHGVDFFCMKYFYPVYILCLPLCFCGSAFLELTENFGIVLLSCESAIIMRS